MSPIILALDYARISDAEDILSKVRPHIGMIKVGLEMFTALGWESLSLANHFEVPIFLDLKLYDIPTTVAKTTDVVCSKLTALKGEHFLSVHCLGTTKMTKAAFDVAIGSNTKITGITLLSSFGHQELRQLGYSDTRVNIQTADIAERHRNTCGMKHFVCGPAYINLMRKRMGSSVTIITPGIRPEGEPANEHKNTMTPTQALKNGASWLVVGRPITQASDPAYMASYFAEVAAATKAT